MNDDDRNQPERSLRAYGTVIDEAIANRNTTASAPTGDLIEPDGGIRRRFISGPTIAAIGIAASFLVVGLFAVNRTPNETVDSASGTEAIDDQGEDGVEPDENGTGDGVDDGVDGAVVDGSNLTVMPFVYSGLPNPVIEIDDDEADRVRTILDGLPVNPEEDGQVSHEDGLGFIGFQLEHYVYDGQERVVHVSEAGITLHPVGQDAFSATGEAIALADPEGALYQELRSIIERARPDISDGIPDFSG